MKKIFVLLAIVGLIATGCESTNDTNSNSGNSASALPDNGTMPAAPAGGGTKDTH